MLEDTVEELVKSKARWERLHGKQQHHFAFAYLGWKWTPAVCPCRPAHVLAEFRLKGYHG